MRHRADSNVDEPTTSDRLAAMQLRRGGWVPETPDRQPELPVVDEVGPPPMPPRAAPPTMADLARAWLQDRLPPWAHERVDRLSVGSLVTGMVGLVIVVLVGISVLHHRAPATAPTSYSGGSSSPSYVAPIASSAPSVAADATSIVIDVGGRVRKPGLVTLPPGARVADAIRAAGGPLRHRELARIDLAARVADGQLLLVGVKTDPVAGSAPTASSSTAPVSLNTATLEQLETLPGIGPVTGQKILDWRTAHSGFTSVEQLQQVSGIGPATYAELSPVVTL